MNKRSWHKTAGILIVLFIIIVFGGRYLVSQRSPGISIGTSTPAVVEQDTDTPESQASQSQAVAPAPSEPSCSETLEAKVKNERIDYVRGSILVTFKAGTSYDQAKASLALHGATTQDTSQAR